MYVTVLRWLSEFCGFEGTLDDMLCDHLVRGIGDAKVQCRLFAEPDLKF